MASTRKYDVDQINLNGFIKTFRKEKPKLIQTTKTEDCERLAVSLIKSIQIALEKSCPKLTYENKVKQSIVNRVPRRVSELFLISKSLTKENRIRTNRLVNYQNTKPNYSKYDFFEKQLAFYVGDQCPNQMVYKQFNKPINRIEIDEETIREVFDTYARPGKIPGLDFIPTEIWQIILKFDGDYLIQFIRELFKFYVPKVFKESKLVIFRKPNRSGYSPENYRFITIQR